MKASEIQSGQDYLVEIKKEQVVDAPPPERVSRWSLPRDPREQVLEFTAKADRLRDYDHDLGRKAYYGKAQAVELRRNERNRLMVLVRFDSFDPSRRKRSAFTALVRPQQVHAPWADALLEAQRRYEKFSDFNFETGEWEENEERVSAWWQQRRAKDEAEQAEQEAAARAELGDEEYEARQAARQAHFEYVNEDGTPGKQYQVRNRWKEIHDAAQRLIVLIEGGEPCAPPASDVAVLRKLLTAIDNDDEGDDE